MAAVGQVAALKLQANENVIPLLPPFHANESKWDCDLYLWEFFQCVVIRNLNPGVIGKERDRGRKRGREGKKKRKREIQYAVGQKNIIILR